MNTSIPPSPNKPTAPNPAIASRWHAGHLWRGVGEPGRSAAFAMKRFVITVLIATMLHAIGCILAPPFEFGHSRAECFFFAFGSGLMAFPILFAVLLLPLRAGLRRFMPARPPHTRAIAAFIVLLAVRASFTLPRQLSGVPAPPYMHGYLAHWIFWSVFIAVITIAFFWPFGTQIRSSSYDHAA